MLAGVGAGRAHAAVLVLDGILGQLPQLGGALAGFLHDLARGLDRRHAAREGRAAAAGEEVVAELAGVADLDADLVEVDAELLGRHHAQRGAQAADVGRAGRQRQRAVLVELQRHGGLAADVEPEAGGDAAALVLARAACANAACDLAASSVSTRPIGPNFGP